MQSSTLLLHATSMKKSNSRDFHVTLQNFGVSNKVPNVPTVRLVSLICNTRTKPPIKTSKKN